MKQAQLTAIIFMSLAIFIGQAFATDTVSVPPLVNYQGKLTDADGKALTGTADQLSFEIYDAPEGGTKIWGPQVFTNVPLINGYFNVILGTTDTAGNSIADAFDSNSRYLGIIYNGNEILPRQQILSTPYAIQAQQAITFHASDYITAMGGIHIGGTTDPGTDNLVVDGKINTINTNGLPFLKGYIKGCGFAYHVTGVSIHSGYLEIDGGLYQLAEDFTKTVQGTANQLIYLYFAKPASGNVIGPDSLETSTTIPKWDSSRLGWYKNGDATRRCIGMVYMSGDNTVTPFDYVNGEYLYRKSFDKGLLSEDSADIMILSEVPPCSRIAVGLATLGAYKESNVILYTHPIDASNANERIQIAQVKFDTGHATNDGGGSTYLRTAISTNGNSTKFGYFLDIIHGHDGGRYYLNGFYWCPDKE
ncbi:MAG: hypothetical protein GY749_33770 [Desulfobacteraceae bacterium]|nr:hypothetical protein [Desulfobacteraceae bacterium]